MREMRVTERGALCVQPGARYNEEIYAKSREVAKRRCQRLFAALLYDGVMFWRVCYARCIRCWQARGRQRVRDAKKVREVEQASGKQRRYALRERLRHC